MAGYAKWKWGGGAAIILAFILLWDPFHRAIFSAHLALSFQKVASGATGQGLPVKEIKVRRQFLGQDYEALVYHPAEYAARRAVILVPGLSELGCYHPRLVALARFLADQGLLVITPDIREFRQFQISAEPIDQILFWFRQTPGLEGGAKVLKTGLAGISYSGTLALIAAAKPEIRTQVGFVVAIGPYSSLIRCTRDWFAAVPETAGSEYYPTKFYAKWIVMLAALDMVVDSKERLFLHEVLDDLLLQKKVPSAGSRISAEGARWYALATMPANQSDPELALEIEKHLVPRIYLKLDPGQTLDKIRCPVFLVHGAYDDLIPPGESLELHRRIADSHVLISPFLTHTHPTDTPLSVSQKLSAVLDTLSFCYQISKVIR